MNTEVTFTQIEPLYKKPNGLYVQEIDRTDLPFGFDPVVRHLVTIPASGISANHLHPRTEAFIGIGNDLEFFWLDANGNRQSRAMNPDNQLLLVLVPPNVPHAIKNNSDTPAILLEYADKKQTESDITNVNVI